MIVIVDFANNSIRGTEVGKVGKVGSGRKMAGGGGMSPIKQRRCQAIK